MGGAAFLLLVFLAACASENISSLGWITRSSFPLELSCKLYVKLDGRTSMKSKVTVRPAQKESIVHAFCPNSFSEEALVCELDGESFKLTELLSADNQITCSCLNDFCLAKKAKIEQKFENNSWDRTSSWITPNPKQELFQISSLKTTNNETCYRCVFQLDDRFRFSVRQAARWHDAVVALWVTLVFLVVIFIISRFVSTAFKRMKETTFTRPQQHN